MIKIYYDDNSVHEVNPLKFGSGEQHFELPTSDNPINIRWEYENDAELFTLACVRDFYGRNEANLYIPYLCHSRMDRAKRDTDVFTLKTFCKLINAMNFNKVFTVDVHSHVSKALLNNLEVIYPGNAIENAINRINKDNLVVFFPDKGAMKRYSTRLPYTFGIKNRNWETGRIKDYMVVNPEMVKGKPVLIVDDICSYGNTFIHAAKALRAAGATEVYLYVTHCENSIFKGEVLTSGLIDKVYTYGTIRLDNYPPNVEVV